MAHELDLPIFKWQYNLSYVTFQSVPGVLLYRNFTTFTTGHFKKDATTAAVDLPKGEFYLFRSSASFLKVSIPCGCLKAAASERLGVAYLTGSLTKIMRAANKFFIDLQI